MLLVQAATSSSNHSFVIENDMFVKKIGKNSIYRPSHPEPTVTPTRGVWSMRVPGALIVCCACSPDFINSFALKTSKWLRVLADRGS